MCVCVSVCFTCICNKKSLMFQKKFLKYGMSDNAIVPDFILKEIIIASHLVILYMFDQ